MKIDVVNGGELTGELRSAWHRLQSNNHALNSPYFCHQYVSLASQIRNDVYVSVLQEDNQIVGFFPFQRGLGGFGRPVGGVMSDYHGLISANDLVLDIERLLQDSGLVRWDFDHLVQAQSAFKPYHRTYARSPIIDLQAGFESYRTSREKEGTKLFTQIARKQRKLEREVGPVRFEPYVANAEVLSTCLAWKSQQYRNSGIRDLFSLDWPIRLLETLQETRSKDFAGMLSALWTGEHLAAVHMGIRSRDIWHYWFPSYDTALGKYSPGQILLQHMAEFAPSIGIKAFDLGKGSSQYKSQWANTSVCVCEGRVEVPSPVIRVFNFAERIKNRFSRNPSSLMQLPVRALAKYDSWRRYQ